MQKLLRRSVSSGPTIICTAASSSTTSACLPSNRNVLSLGSSRTNGKPFLSLQLGMPTTTAFHLHHPVGCTSTTATFSRKHVPSAAANSTVSYNVGSFLNFSNSYVSRFPALGSSTITAKSWFICDEKSSGSCLASFTTDVGKHVSGFETFEGDVDNGGKNVKDLGVNVLEGSDGGDPEKLSSSLEEKPLKLHRRQKGGSSAMGLTGNPDLLTIPGVGPRNLRKLVEKGIGGVAELKQLYKDKFFGKTSQKMVEFLRSSVGIVHRSHAERITTYIKESVDEELKNGSNSDVKPAQKKRMTFCVEGNISVGKTTFLQRIANETLELQDLVEIVPEPINKWQDVGPDHFNILDAFYAEPQRYAYTFQNYVFVTRVMQERESAVGIKPLRLMERSVFSDRMVFVRAVHEANWMNEMEISIYDSWFDPVVSSLPGLIPDGFIYLRASPDTCHKRMLLRKRAEEGGVSLDYLRDLHEKHESWLFPFQSGNHGVLSVSKLPLGIDRTLHPDIRDRVFYLEGNHMHSSIQKVPALVLDCEPNIDFSKDIEAKREYARQVAEFFEFVKKRQEISDTKAHEESVKGSQLQVLLPHKDGLWVPDMNHFPKPAIGSLDFRRSMSITSG